MREKNVLKILACAPKWKNILVNLRLKWEVNIKMGIGEVCFEHVELICQVKDRIHQQALVNTKRIHRIL
jgi:hypothetical protein